MAKRGAKSAGLAGGGHGSITSTRSPVPSNHSTFARSRHFPTKRKIGHRETSDSKRMFVTHWIEIISDEGRIFMRADDDWWPLLDSLARRWPQAILERGE